MSTLEMLDALIGMVFIFLLLSLACTALNELIESFLKKRASDLERGIKELLLPNNAGDVNNLMRRFYEHPIIAGLYRGNYKPGGSNLPSYIPAQNFAYALMDVILPASSANVSGAAGGNPVADSAGNSQPVKSLNALRNAIIAWPDTTAKTAVLTLIDSSENNIAKARNNIEGWFNSSMDRVSGWYKRRCQKILIVLGFLLAVAMNTDTIAIFKSLVNDPPLRNSLVAAAQEYAKTYSAADTALAITRVDNNAAKLYNLRLPIGWDWKAQSTTITGTQNSITNYALAIPWSSGNLFANWILKIIGWLITALAVSLGASFWFDTLNKIMIIRSTVKPHEKSPEESSEDRQSKN